MRGGSISLMNKNYQTKTLVKIIGLVGWYCDMVPEQSLNQVSEKCPPTANSETASNDKINMSYM